MVQEIIIVNMFYTITISHSNVCALVVENIFFFEQVIIKTS